jgi:[ribosomal protein S5]-alanine N-acetyltransferase
MAVQLVYWQEEYAEQLSLIANNYLIAKYMRNRFPYPYAFEDAVSFINMVQENYPNLVFAIEADGVIVGSIGIFPGEDIYCSTVELGYWIGQEYWGRGIATAALTLMIEYTFANFLYNKIKAHVFHTNNPSMRVLEKCGFHKEAILQKSVYKFEEYLDEHLFAIFNPNTIYSSEDKIV